MTIDVVLREDVSRRAQGESVSVSPRLDGQAFNLVQHSSRTPANRRSVAGVLYGRTVLPWVLPAMAVLLWYSVTASGYVSPNILPSPLTVLTTAEALWSAGTLQHDIWVSLGRIAFGFALGSSTGFLLGIAVGISSRARLVFDRSVQMIRTIPHLALVPLMILWFGIGEQPKVLLVALGALFPVYINTASGIRNVDPKLIELGRAYGLSQREIITQIVLPAALQPILVGVRYALGVAWLTLVVAETIASREGIGYLVQNARELLRTDIIILAIILYSIAGWLADWLIRIVESRLLRWHPNYAPGANK
ncbi:ABC transporter permease [Phyllobacterium endophyticum]|uniref:ABC transporter permease n=1 Tax=Phyllobacterium endophyticum TaxID=1149773 RepID=UPI001650139C|nr:ABC transporter permease subunit [Phyllobacterium endophyticum]